MSFSGHIQQKCPNSDRQKNSFCNFLSFVMHEFSVDQWLNNEASNTDKWASAIVQHSKRMRSIWFELVDLLIKGFWNLIFRKIYAINEILLFKNCTNQFWKLNLKKLIKFKIDKIEILLQTASKIEKKKKIKSKIWPKKFQVWKAKKSFKRSSPYSHHHRHTQWTEAS